MAVQHNDFYFYLVLKNFFEKYNMLKSHLIAHRSSTIDEIEKTPPRILILIYFYLVARIGLLFFILFEIATALTHIFRESRRNYYNFAVNK